jgi:hypothetical protein
MNSSFSPPARKPDAGLECLTRSYAAAEIRIRKAAGKNDSQAFRADCLIRHRLKIASTETLVGAAAPALWRAALNKARLQHYAPVGVVAATTLWVSFMVPVLAWATYGAAAVVLARLVKQPVVLRVPDPHAPLFMVIGWRTVRRFVRSHGDVMPAAALSHRTLGMHLQQRIDDLDPQHRAVAQALLPDFPGTVGELVEISKAVAR